MSDTSGKDYQQTYSAKWNTSLEKGSSSDALLNAIKGYLIAVDVDDDISRKIFLTLMRTSINNVWHDEFDRADEEANSRLVCSFCGRSIDEVKIVSGAHGSICQICAAQIHDHFTRQS
jgi:hypothetical protein